MSKFKLVLKTIPRKMKQWIIALPSNLIRWAKIFASNFGWKDLLVYVITFLLNFVTNQASYIDKPLSKIFLISLASTLDTLIPIYFNHLVLVRRYFDKGKFNRYILALTVFWLFITSLTLLIPGEKKVLGRPITNEQMLIFAAMGNMMSLLVGLTILLARRSIIQTQKKLKNQLLFQEMEMKLLKAQLNPHFLFNSLNNIYALSLDSLPETSDMILKLSELMRYQLQSSKKEMVPLEDELNFIRNYIELEKIRLTDRADVQLHIEGEGIQAKIAPMILIPYIENSFKHGIDTLQDSFIHIYLKIDEERLDFSVENSIPAKKLKRISTETGMDNTRRRLDLLYKNRYLLKAEAEGNTFKVNLVLNII